MNSQTGETFPSDQGLADRDQTFARHRQAGAHLKLRQIGWLDWTGNPGSVNSYRILMDHVAGLTAEIKADDERRRQNRRTPYTHDLGGRSPVYPHPVHTRPTNSHKEPSKGTHIDEREPKAGSEHIAKPKPLNEHRSQRDDRQEAFRRGDCRQTTCPTGTAAEAEGGRRRVHRALAGVSKASWRKSSRACRDGVCAGDQARCRPRGDHARRRAAQDRAAQGHRHAVHSAGDDLVKSGTLAGLRSTPSPRRPPT